MQAPNRYDPAVQGPDHPAHALRSTATSQVGEDVSEPGRQLASDEGAERQSWIARWTHPGRSNRPRASSYRYFARGDPPAKARQAAHGVCDGRDDCLPPRPRPEQWTVHGPLAIPRPASPVVDPFLDDLEQRTFDFFWDTANPRQRAGAGSLSRRPPFSSIAAIGFGLTAYAIGVERGYVTREQARAADARDAALPPRRAAGRAARAA